MTCSKGHLLSVSMHQEWTSLHEAIKLNAIISCEWLRGNSPYAGDEDEDDDDHSSSSLNT